MNLLVIFLPLAAMFQQSLGQPKSVVVSDLSAAKQKEIIDKLNGIRKNVQPTARNMLKMVWNNAAAQSAKQWAAKCLQQSSPIEERTLDGTFCGEGRLQATYAATWNDVIDTWYAKSSNFKYGVGAVDPKKDVYSYTQLIWYNSNKIGCAVAYCPQNNFPFYYVCRYCPAGNILEQIATPYKEGPPCGDCPNDCEDKLCTNSCSSTDERNDCSSLLTLFSCEEEWVAQQCKATCECASNII